MNKFTLLIGLLSVGIAAAQTAPSYSIKPGGKAVVKISYRNNIRNRPVFSYMSSVLPYNAESRIEDSLPTGSGDKYLVYEAAAPQHGLLTIDRYGDLIYLVPGDTLTLSIDLSSPKTWQSYQFLGQYAAMNQYYFDQGKALKGSPSHARGRFVNEAATLSRYRQQMDSLLQVEQQFLLTYSRTHRLPAWFIRDEKQRILYNDASARANAAGYRQFIKKDKLEDLPKDYFSFVTPALLNNSPAAYLYDYQRFLKDYFYQLYFGQKQNRNITDFITKLATKALTGAAWDVFMTRYVDELLAGLPTEGEKVLAAYYPRFTNKQWIDERKAYYQDAYTLKPGKAAPNFALTDESDSLTYLKDYRGQVVYLSFWFTGCAPCRQEMPYENELVKHFEGKPVKVVSICVMSSREDWAKVSNLYQLQTVNLYANKAWEKTVIEKYNVKAYPHYVLIDQAGNVVMNNCSRPSGNARTEIEALLKR